ncbi:MAG: hypothetical protein PHD00_01115 [Bacteroidales bacterium]|nr:hypothetical protein [Bacteroidales bacterium]MDD4672536.1 hypothetical protein [Bacteroidales bacterium]MDY0349133.1 hypothetical protein [Tenuifilaceae bacterium]
MKRLIFRVLLIAFTITNISQKANAWSEHPLLAYPVLSSIEQLTNENPIMVKSLKAFLIEQEKELEVFFREQEIWLLENLSYYPALPEHLRFKATGNPDDILERFFKAIRLNPNARMRLYQHLLPNEQVADRPTIDPKFLTTLEDVSGLLKTNYIELFENDSISPMAVLLAANDEPDYGFDLGLFKDNNTPQGDEYGFGEQPFGDPNLAYGSQAPFHMGFYHEARIVFLFGSFLKKTLPEMRINQFKMLAEFAFKSDNPYWGYRFMGWGMHYLGDLSMPYHTVALPGVSALKMIWTNIKAMLGFPKSKDDAVQLVSNRHAAMEEFQWQVLRQAYESSNFDHLLLSSLQTPIDMVEYYDNFPREVAAKESAAKAKMVDKMLEQWMPAILVSNPSFETPGSTELSNIIELTKQEKGEQGITEMTDVLADIFRSYSMHIQSFYHNIMDK